MAKIRMIITAEFDQPTAGLYASWTAQEQRRAIMADLSRLMPKYINAELYEQGVEQPATVTVALGAL